MRDAKILFREKVAPSTASVAVDTGGSDRALVIGL